MARAVKLLGFAAAEPSACAMPALSLANPELFLPSSAIGSRLCLWQAFSDLTALGLALLSFPSRLSMLAGILRGRLINPCLSRHAR